MRTCKRKFYSLPLAAGLVLLALASAPCATAADIVVVANPKVADGSLSGDQVKSIFLG